MTTGDWERAKEIFESALDLDALARTAFLERACAGDVQLRQTVEELFASDQEMGAFLAQPAAELVAAALGEPATCIPHRHIGPSKISREIGDGGMGTVYLAERADGQYRQRVAIKVIKAGLSSDILLRRFRNERQVLAALTHPNIARLLDGGATEDGLPYLVMEYVDGERIDLWCNNHKLPVRDRLRLFQRVCDAVQYAHANQVIHRDLKPGNILVTSDGNPKLLDFGVAKATDLEPYGEITENTTSRAPITPEYASPEQMRGQPVGPGSDVYALGMVLYRLLTDRLPYVVRGCVPAQMARVICEQEPVKPSNVDSDASSAARGESPAGLRRRLAGDLDKIVLKALRKEPEHRYVSVAEFSDDIDRFLKDQPVRARKETLPYRSFKFLKRNRVPAIAAAFSAALALALMTGLLQFGRSNHGTDAGIRSVAVLPLDNLSGDQEQEYFADGVTDALISELARIGSLRVISRTSVMLYKRRRVPLPEIARKLGVQTIAEGSVLRAANRVRIAVRLVDAQKDRPVWSGSYAGELQNVLALQSQVAEAIATEIHVTLTAPNQTRISRSRRVDLGAYDSYLRGRHQFVTEFSDASIQKAIGWFHRALAFDPTYAPAYAGLADCYYMVSNQYYRPTEVMPKAKWAAQKALELDDTLGEAHATLALVRSLYEFNRPEAEKGFRRAIELKPSDAEAHLWYGLHLAGMGRFHQAVAEVEQAQKLDPVSPGISAYIGAPLYLAHEYDQAIQRILPIAGMYPDNMEAHAFLALSYEQKCDWTKAIAEMERAYQLEKEPQSLAQLGHIYAVSGRTADARKVLGQLKNLSRQRYVTAYDIAVLYAGLGERDEAFRWLQEVERDRSEWFAVINVDPRLDGLHSDPRGRAYCGV